VGLWSTRLSSAATTELYSGPRRAWRGARGPDRPFSAADKLRSLAAGEELPTVRLQRSRLSEGRRGSDLRRLPRTTGGKGNDRALRSLPRRLLWPLPPGTECRAARGPRRSARSALARRLSADGLGGRVPLRSDEPGEDRAHDRRAHRQRPGARGAALPSRSGAGGRQGVSPRRLNSEAHLSFGADRDHRLRCSPSGSRISNVRFSFWRTISTGTCLPGSYERKARTTCVGVESCSSPIFKITSPGLKFASALEARTTSRPCLVPKYWPSSGLMVT